VDGVNHQLSGDLLRGVELLRDQWWPSTVEGIAQGALYALVAVGLTVVHRTHRSLDLGQLAAFSLGLFGVYAAFFALGFRPGATAEGGVLGFLLLGFVAAVAVSGVTSVALGLAYRPLRGRPPWFLLLVGLGVFLVVQQALRLLRGPEPEPPIRLFRPHELVPGVDDVQLAIVVIALGLVAGAAVLARRTGWAFATSGVLMGAAATLYLLKVPTAAWHLTAVQVGLYAVAAVLLGDPGRVRGALLAAVALGLAQAYAQTVVSDKWRYFLAAGLLVLAAVLRWWLARRAATRLVT
jgi:branched-chain amino acid transport system permease protein